MNGTWSQPVGVNVALSEFSVTVAGAHDVGKVMNSLSSVRPIELMGRPPVWSSAIVESRPPSGRRRIDASFLTSPMIAMPSRAGSPGSGSRLKIWPSGSALTLAVPTCDASEHPIPRNAASEHRGAAFGLPTRPGGSRRLRCSASRRTWR